jgi:hypothetical protein
LLNTPSAPDALSTKELLQELSSNASILIQRQVKLATLESKRQTAREKTSVELLGIAGAIAYAGVILLLVAAALGIGAALGDRFWAGALIVAAALLFVAAILAPIGWTRRVKAPLHRTRSTIDKELTWAKTQLT